MIRRCLLTACVAGFPAGALAQTATSNGAAGADWIAIGMFLAIVGATLVITYRAAGSTNSKAGFYTAGHAITPLQNGLATAGDFLSAAAFLGITALI
jgi:cation/acetate symporter